MRSLQELRLDFIKYSIQPTAWLGDSPSRFDFYTNSAFGHDTILELGVYSGLTTTAFMMAKPKKLVSIDITSEYFTAHEELVNQARLNGVDYQFLVMDDLEYDTDGQDLLFIDTSHPYEQTIAELNRFGQATKNKIILHDISSSFGVYHAVFQWLWENKNFVISEHDTRGDGVVVLERIFGF